MLQLTIYYKIIIREKSLMTKMKKSYDFLRAAADILKNDIKDINSDISLYFNPSEIGNTRWERHFHGMCIITCVTPSRNVDHIIRRNLATDNHLLKYKMPIEYYQQSNKRLLKDIKSEHLRPFVWDIVGLSVIKRIEMLRIASNII